MQLSVKAMGATKKSTDANHAVCSILDSDFAAASGKTSFNLIQCDDIAKATALRSLTGWSSPAGPRTPRSPRQALLSRPAPK